MGAQVLYDSPTQAVALTSVEFLNVSGAVADPSSITAVVVDPAGTITNYLYAAGSGLNQIVKVSPGNYSLTIDGISVPGLYTFTWVGSGNQVQQVTSGTFRLIPLTDIGMGMQYWYTGMEELKSRLGLPPGDKNYNSFNYEMQVSIHCVANWINRYCVVPETPVLTADLRWVPAGSLAVGDELVGVDEYPVGPSRPKRNFRKAVVAAVPRRVAACTKITLSDGREVISAADHRWLGRSNKGKTGTVYQWMNACAIQPGYDISAPMRPWEEGKSFEDGWEGGQVTGSARVMSVEPAGVREVVSIGTTTGTYIANGLVSHNCGRHFYRLQETRTYMPDTIWELGIDDIVPSLAAQTVVNLDYDGDGIFETSWGNPAPPVGSGSFYALKLGGPSNYQDNYNPNAAGGVARPYNQLQALMIPGAVASNGAWLPFVWPYSHLNRVQVVTTWGWDYVPPEVTMASMMLCTDIYKSKDTPWGMAGTAEVGMVRVQSNPWVVELLRPYINGKRKWGV